MEEDSKKEIKNKISKQNLIIISILVIILIAVFTLVIIQICNAKNNNEGKNIINTIKIDETKITKEKTARMLQVEELQKENTDIVGWIEIENTDISYPVLQGTDNSYYMTHTYNKEYSQNGSIFLDKDYDWNKPSSNLLMYGHNNKNGTMFQDLLLYKEESYYKEHPKIKFTTATADEEYEIIAAFLSRVYYKSEKNVFRYYYFIDADTEEEYNEFVENSKEVSLYDTGKTAEYGDQLITLSTCSYHTEDGRFAVVARKIK